MRQYTSEELKRIADIVWACLEAPMEVHGVEFLIPDCQPTDYPIKVKVDEFGNVSVQINTDEFMVEKNRISSNATISMDEALRSTFAKVNSQNLYGYYIAKFHVELVA